VTKHIEKWSVEPGKVAKSLLKPSAVYPTSKAEVIMVIIIINVLMPTPMIVVTVQESYWYSKHRSIGPNLASVADGQSCLSLG
jgi:hypothetical protein